MPASSSGQRALLDQPLQLSFSRRALRSLFGLIHAAAQPERLVRVREWVASVDEDGRRAPELRAFSGLRGVDQLVPKLHVASFQSPKHRLNALIRQLPVGATIEVLNRDLRDG